MSTTLSSINLNRFAVFVAVVEAGSLTRAASRLGIAKTMVSAHLQRLETEIGASLLVRTTRRLHLTEAGEMFYEAARIIVREAEEAVNAIGQSANNPRGTLRITAPVDYGATVIAPLAIAMQQRYPALKIDLLTGDRLFDLIAEGIDVAIRLGRLADSTLQAVQLGRVEEWLVAAPGVLPAKIKTTSPKDLTDLPFIGLSILPRPTTWRFERDGQSKQTVTFSASFTVNTAHAARAAVLAGGGLAVLPDFSIAQDVEEGRLVRVLPKWKLPGGGIFAVYPMAKFRPQKIRVFVDALKAEIEQSGRGVSRVR
ncbi:LysR family transcriptional regulator [Dyella psychrodurans]|uniref:LysR family transcriptional regulator n=1 Tax=Dyella psychrodurans TaxID=1927960 RepID=A0A370XCK6_9GAMM|nr:LysR family transcriptional regulator [Dyella psychrodurans]RDS86138.1 LysR family transcriptional regulator [Dyella psychrodurans]